jgi:hypothetical protein
MSFKCGNCQGSHDTVGEARDCYSSGAKVAPAASNKLVSVASERQQKYIQDLILERDVSGIEMPTVLTVSAASELIKTLLARPKVQPAADIPIIATPPGYLQDLLPDIPHARYAIQEIDFTISPEPVWKFYQVDKPQEGRWAGRTFLKAQASDELWPIRDKARIRVVLEAILHDPTKAMIDYGRQIGHCAICGRTLTNEESIAAGIGPICAGRYNIAS